MNTTGDLSKSHLFTLHGGTIVSAEQSPDEDRHLDRRAESIVDEKYEIIALLGKGGMGAVYRARHLMLSKDVALKTFRTANLTDEACLRFQREAKAIAKLNHKHVVQVFDFGLFEDGVPYYTMEFLLGQSLADGIKKNGRMPIERTIELFVQTCQGLSTAHDKGIIHRDLKPGNLFIESILVPRGKIDVIKVVDFGIASLINQAPEGQEITTHGTIFGSPLYMSPEHSMGHDATAASDIYSLGCSLFETLTGVPPFRGKHALETVMMHQSQTPPSLREASGDQSLPLSLEHLVASMLAKSPDHRPGSMDQVAAELTRIASKKSTGGSTSVAPDQRPSMHDHPATSPDRSARSRRHPPKLPDPPPKLQHQPARSQNSGSKESTGEGDAAVARDSIVARDSVAKNAFVGRESASPSPLRDQNADNQLESSALPRWAMIAAVSFVAGLMCFGYYLNRRETTGETAQTMTKKVETVSPNEFLEDGGPKGGFAALDKAVRVSRIVIKARNGKEYITFTFPVHLDYGTFNSAFLQGWEIIAREKVSWDSSLKVTFSPREPFLLLCDSLSIFQPNDLWGLNLRKCPREQKDAKVVRQISKLTGLHLLDLSESDLSAGDIASLGRLKNLEYLFLSDTNVPGKALGTVPQLKNLVSLSFSRSQGASDLLAKLQGSSHIETLHLDDDYLSHEDFKRIATLTELKKLHINNCTISQTDLEALTPLTKLVNLTCRKSKLPWTSVEPLKILKKHSLSFLDISECDLPRSLVNEIKRAVPQVQTEVDELENLDSLPSSVWKGLDH